MTNILYEEGADERMLPILSIKKGGWESRVKEDSL